MFFRALPAVLLLACDPSGPSDTEDEEGLCSAYTLEGVSPADGADGVYLAEDFDRIELRYEPSPALPFIDVIPAGGEPVDGRTYEEDGAWVFVPYEPLPADTAIDVSVRTVEHCEPEVVTSFTTGPWEEADPDAIAGEAWLLQAEGDGFAEFTVGEMPFALWVRAASGGDLDLSVVPMDGDSQEVCLPTTGFGATVEGPVLTSEKVTAPFGYAFSPVWLVEAEIRGLLRPDGSGLDHVSVVGQIDVAGFADCELVAATGSPCVPCSDGNGETCIDLDATGGTADGVGFTPIGRSEAQVSADEEC